ncbi:alpha/beta-hydrolase [Zopfia rhizophila CBS 207.26]|uniref:Alpha/beta-hydrolase n=1 Tax=Zopfia rhizophila CBS 207.26 TaxID=1314779 RepID=A0A6A6DFB7_9PEZI|nr:alpha/beta-hydrolase [Zopfia rhizophila CBS 207.26]
MAEHNHLAKPHPEWADFPRNLPKDTSVIWMTRDRKPVDPALHPDPNISEFNIPARGGCRITLRSYSNKKYTAGQKLLLFIYIHGGGFVTGSLETDDSSCRAVALDVPVHVPNVEYRLAPERKFPTGFERLLRRYLAKDFILGGTSAGASFTAGIAHLRRDEGNMPRLTGLERTLSVADVDDAPGLTKKPIAFFAKEQGAPPSDTRYSPLLFESHVDLAKKAFFADCGWDPRRNEALLLGDILEENGVEVKKKVYVGLPHGFWTTCPDLQVAKDWERGFVEAMRWVVMG